MIRRGGRPPGWVSTPEAWRYVDRAGRRLVAALLRPISFDGTQPCAGWDDWIQDRWEDDHAALLKRVCASCPFMEKCAEWGLAHEEHGVWGGMTPTERRAARKRRGILLVNRDSADLHQLVGHVGYRVS